MHDLAPMCALGGTEPTEDHVKGVTLSENPQLALASVASRHGQESVSEAHLQDLLGRAIPGPGKAVLNDPLECFWMGPDQWMVSAPFSTHEDLAMQLSQRLSGSASITDQSDAWVCFDMRGDGIEAVAQLCCNIDIERMQTGDAARTVIHHIGCFVLRRDPANWLSILGPRSFAGSLHHALLTAMRAAL